MISADDARRLHLSEGDRVVVETEAGSLPAHVAIVEIRPGNIAMYYPEANVLVPRRLDPRSKTPAFKSVAASIRRAGEPRPEPVRPSSERLPLPTRSSAPPRSV